MRENAEMALSSAIGEQVAKIAGAVWIHNLHSTGEEKMAIQTPEGRTITTSLKPSDVCDLICAFMYPAMRLPTAISGNLRQPLNLICG